jgi:hypothetical protein
MIQGFSGGLLNRQLIYQTDLPSFQRDFASLKTLDHGTGPAITFTRASGATYFDADGVLQTAANDAPRFDHDPVTGASRGLLIEEARTNLLVRSAEFDDAAWTKADASVSANNSLAPDNTTTADLLTSSITGGSNTCYVDRGVFVSASTDYTFSVFLKAATSATTTVNFYRDIPYAESLAEITWGSPPTMTTYGAILVGSSLTVLSDGWVRVSLTVNSATATGLVCRVYVLDQGVSNSTSDSVLLWGAQLEAGAFPTSYIPTTTAAATRAADSAIVTPISSFYNQSEGTLFAESSFTSSVPSSSTAVIIDNNHSYTDMEHMQLWRYFDDGYLYASLLDNNTVVAQVDNGAAATAGTVYKLIMAAANNNFAASFNGSSAAVDTSCTMPNVSHLRLGATSALMNSHLNGHIRKVAYWPKRLTNTLLEQLTT